MSSSYFFDENAREFKTFKIADTASKVNGLLTPSVSTKYALELKKQAMIVEYVEKVREEGNKYEKAIIESFINGEVNSNFDELAKAQRTLTIS